ncbi:hypothetical protein ACX2QB_05965 [Weissella viridescens]|uniref:hypothetical protein n=1 Tax=Weissella viridescens TaxID=1629 RepID=UPI0035292667
MYEQNKKPEYEEIDIDLNEHDVEIFSKAGSYLYVKVDGEYIDGGSTDRLLKRVEFIAPLYMGEESNHKKTLKVIMKNLEH